MHLLLVATGCQLREVSSDLPLSASSPADMRHRLIVDVLNAPERKGNGMRCLVALRWEIRSGHCYLCREKLLVYFRNCVDTAGWQPGCVRIMETKLLLIRNIPDKPGAAGGGQHFDYTAWCARRHIYSRGFSGRDEGLLLSAPHGFRLQRTLNYAQESLRRICRRYVPQIKQGGLLEALLIGYTHDVDPEVLRAYSDAGVVHIIAISGLHLALIGELLQMSLLILGSTRGMRILRIVLLLSVVWGYSLLTGASPSVLRSAVMFSFVILARHFSLRAPVLNALAASAFLLICDDPFRLWDTGFQLSYAAVLSLVLFASPVRDWIRPANKLLSALWKAASVSIAAQILTTPVSIWYFHRFPFYFLISNLVAVPLSSAILIGGIALLTFSAIPAIALPIGMVLDLALKIMNGFVAYSNRLPGAAITGIPIRLLQVILCYSMLYSACRYPQKAEKYWLFAFLFQVCFFLVDGLNN